MNLQRLNPYHRRNEERITLEQIANQDTPTYIIGEAIMGYQLRYGNDTWIKKYQKQTQKETR